MNRHEHEQQRGWVQQSLALSPSESERHNAYPRRVRRRCPTCGRPMVKAAGRLSCVNANCTHTYDERTTP